MNIDRVYAIAKSLFLEMIRSAIRLRGYSLRTEKTYLHWIKRFIYFHGKHHPNTMGAVEVKAFLSNLATEGNVAINTQKTALNALAFMYNQILQQPLGRIFHVRTKQKRLKALWLLVSRQYSQQNRGHPLFSD